MLFAGMDTHTHGCEMVKSLTHAHYFRVGYPRVPIPMGKTAIPTDNSRAYLVSGHDRMRHPTGFYQTSSFLVAPQSAHFGPTLIWSTGPGLLIKKEG